MKDPVLSNRQIRFTDESCEVVDTDAARGAEVLRSARTNSMNMAQSPGETLVKTAKIVTFNLNDSID